MDTFTAFVASAISFVTGWFVGLTTNALSAFVIGLTIGLAFPWLWREFIGPKVSNAKHSKRLGAEE